MRGHLTDPSPPRAFSLLAYSVPRAPALPCGLPVCTPNRQLHLLSLLQCPAPILHLLLWLGLLFLPLGACSSCSSLLPLALLASILPCPLSIWSPRAPLALQNGASQQLVHNRDTKALLAYSKGQSFQSPLSSQIPCSRAEGSWKNRSRKQTEIVFSIMCQQYAGCYASLISLNPHKSLEVSIIIDIFQRKKLRI